MAELRGPLDGLRVVEFAGLGPAPFAAMVLADLGAEVIRIDRPTTGGRKAQVLDDFLLRSRRSIVIDLKQEAGVEVALDLVETADVLIEGFRPGVMERLGLGPDVCLARNSRLVFGRMTGWGQDGPLAMSAGHDIDYIAVAGALHPIGRSAAPPPPPLNLIGDFGGGAMFLIAGVLAALLSRDTAGGQVVDAAMIDGTALLTTMAHSMRAAGMQTTSRESNLLDGGAPFYDTYACADGEFIAVGALEPEFFARFIEGLGLADVPDQYDVARWPELRSLIGSTIAQRTRDEWAEVFDGTDACVAPVLGLGEAPVHPHNIARRVFVDVGGQLHPAPAPRFGVTPSATPQPSTTPGADTDEILEALDYADSDIAELRSEDVVG